MDVIVCIDDTDNKDSKGTGHLVAELCEIIEARGWGKCDPITRHQLFVHPDIPYTSHNSSMCFIAELSSDRLPELVKYAQRFLEVRSAPGSDPGLCIFEDKDPARLDELKEFGLRAKRTVLNKEMAYSLAERLRIHLSEHGGTGSGVIGALAGSGLRIGGNDGRFRGHIDIETKNGLATAGDILRETTARVIRSVIGEPVGESEIIRLGDKIKAVLLDGKATLLVRREIETACGVQPGWRTLTKEELRVY